MRGKAIKTILAAGALGLMLTGQTLAADVPVKVKKPAEPATPVFDLAFGLAIMSDYNFRGVSQSNRRFSGGGYIEPQLNVPFGQLYVGAAWWHIKWPTAFGFTNPSAEVDLYGGWRGKFLNDKLAVDLGFIYYYYPSETFNGFTNDSDFWELYTKLAYDVTSDLNIGANFFYTPDLLHYSKTFAAVGVNARARGFYASLTGKYVLPWKQGDLGAYVSGELGHWWIDDTGFLAGGLLISGAHPYVDPSYTYWNAGLALTWKALTVDFRYHGNSMSVLQCASFLVSAVGNPSNRWCRDAFIVSLKFDTTLSALSKP
jgi:uncharacterized protein (TIGR02001 family)